MPGTILGLIRDLYTYRYFNDLRRAPRYRGVYSSFQAAQSALPKNKLQGFNLEAVPEYFLNQEFGLNAADYPVLFWLSRTLKPGAAIFDLGGGLGQCYYNYGRYLAFPPDLRWIVCDVESFLRRGAEVASERNAQGLSFAAYRQMADGVQIYLSNGALHYIEPDLSEMLSVLSVKPEHVLINRVPLYDGPRYYTLQNGRHSHWVNKILNEAEFVGGIENLGYERVDRWRVPRSLHVPFHPECYVANFGGFYFRRK